MKMAKAIAGNSSIAVRMSKSAINKGRNADLDTGLGVELLAWRNCFTHPDREEPLVPGGHLPRRVASGERGDGYGAEQYAAGQRTSAQN